MALRTTTYTTYTHGNDVTVELDHNDPVRPFYVTASTDDDGEPLGSWMSLKELEEFRRDIGHAIRQFRGL